MPLLFHTWCCVYVSTTVSAPPTVSFPTVSTVRSLGLCLYSFPANRFLRTIFLVCCVYFTVYKR